jgi:ABC-type nitrate/sulfonate/bicarbonate transport system substrate-binding protein
MKPAKITSVGHWAVFVALLWLLPHAQGPSAQTKVSIIHAVVGPGETPLWIAHEQGLFGKQGIDVQILLQETPGVARRITGDIQFGQIGIPAAMAAVVEGIDLKILAPVTSARAVNHLVARPEVKTPEDLRGKRFGVFGIGTGFWIQAMLALEHLRLDPTRDRISFVEVGNLPRMARALEAGDIDAAILDPGRSSQLQGKGFSMLLDMSTANISGAQNALVVAGAYLRAHPDMVEKVVAGLVEGIAFSLAPANKEIVLKTLMAHMKLTDPASAENAYKTFASRVLRRPYASVEAMQNMQRVMALHNPKVVHLQLADLIEERFVHTLDKSGVIDRLYSTYGVK